jgi:hypothetical protein
VAGTAPSEITLNVYNYAHVSPRRLAEAEKVASSIFHNAGLEVKWVACPGFDKDQVANPDCVRRLLPSELVVDIMAHQNEAALRHGDSFGYAQVFTNNQFGHYAYLFNNRIEDFAGAIGSAGQLLGDVIAHEIGHLLLGSPGHTSKGLMSARWEKDDLDRLSEGQLRFSPVQGAQLRAGMEARCKGLQEK